MSHTFGKITIADGVKVLDDVGGTGLSGVLIGNESGLTCEVTMVGANVKRTLYPGTVDLFEVPDGRTWNGNLQIDPMAELSNAASYPGSYVRIDTFGPGERPAGQYPMALPRNTNVGNTVQTNVSGTNSVTNDGNPSGTVFVEGKQSGSTGSNISIANDGTITVAQFIASVLTSIFQTIPNGASVVKLGATGLQAEVVGNLLVDQGLTCNGNIFAGAGGSIGGGGLLYSTIGGSNFGLSINGKSSLDNGAITTDNSGNITTSGNKVSIGQSPTVINGATGTASLFQPFTGAGFKLVYVCLNNYKSTAGAQTIALPAQFTTNCFLATTDSAGAQLMKSAVAQNISVITALASGGGTLTTVTTLQNGSIGGQGGGWDTLSFVGGGAVGHNGIMIFAGT